MIDIISSGYYMELITYDFNDMLIYLWSEKHRNVFQYVDAVNKFLQEKTHTN